MSFHSVRKGLPFKATYIFITIFIPGKSWEVGQKEASQQIPIPALLHHQRQALKKLLWLEDCLLVSFLAAVRKYAWQNQLNGERIYSGSQFGLKCTMVGKSPKHSRFCHTDSEHQSSQAVLVAYASVSVLYNKTVYKHMPIQHGETRWGMYFNNALHFSERATAQQRQTPSFT